MPIHPFFVHFTLSLAFLFAAMEIFPSLRERIPEKEGSLIGVGTVVFIALAALSGWLSLETLQERRIPIPPAAAIHRLLALSGSALLALLWIAGLRRLRLAPPIRRSIGLAGLLLLLGAAAVGGHLVYDDRLGTDFGAPSPAAPPAIRP